ncbi:hypothetical protein ACFW04_014690 [Cataglyphis niger]
MLKGYRWEVQLAERRNKKGRAIGGMLLGIKKELKVEEVKVKKRNGLIEVTLKVEDRKWNVIGVYVREEKKLEELNEWMERKKENGCILIGGDFNARTGEEGGVSKGYEEEEGVGRRSRNKKMNKEGKELLRWIEKAGWTIFNGCTKGDGKWTYTGGSGNSVDYVMGDKDTRMQVCEVEVGDNIDSDHHPIIVRIKGGDKIRLRRKERAKKWVWTREEKDEFRKALGNVEEIVGEVKEVWETMRDRIKQVMIGGCVAKGTRRERGWWDSECKEEKGIVRRELRRTYQWRSEISILEIIGRGVESKIVIGQREGFRIDEEESISRSEIRAVIGRLKDNKAVGVDGIPAEVWKYGGENVEEWIWKICNRVWKGERWIDEWNEGVIVPIVKKGEGERVEEYRGVSLTSTLYKVCVSVLAGRFSDEVEEKGLVPQNQTGFRKGLGTMDNIFILNYLVNRQLSKKKGKLARKLEAMREREVREGLIRRSEDIMRETRNRVRRGEDLGTGFWTGRGIRQGCLLSPYLFNLITADMEEVMRGMKIYTLAYADDVVLIAKEEEGMRSMIGKLEGYLEKKRLELNVGKSKILRFRKGGGRDRKVSWRWKGKMIEEVKEFSYLDYVMQRNGGQEAQIRDRLRKSVAVMSQIWGIGKRKLKNDWGRRLWLFDKLVWTVMGYEVEIWGWGERKELERLQERYLRWVLGMEWGTPGYMVREELQRKKLRGRAGKRPWSSRKGWKRVGGRIARRCWKELRERSRRKIDLSKWEKERCRYFEDRGMGMVEVEAKRSEGALDFGYFVKKDMEMNEKERWERRNQDITGSRKIKGSGIPEYLRRDWGKSRWQRMARYRLGNGMKGNWYWKEEEDKKCRLCGREEETWEHVWERCWVEKNEKEGWLRELEDLRSGGENEEGRNS